MFSYLRYIKYGISDPRASLSFISGGKESVRLLSLRRLANLMGWRSDELLRQFASIRKASDFQKEISSRLSDGGRSYYGEVQSPFELYAIVRCLSPENIVETGVASGVSSAYLLLALHDNDKGTLYSVDLPNHELEYFPRLGLSPVSILPEDKPPGFVVPKSLTQRWKLSLGPTREVLPKLLEELGSIDIFFHDSEHTLENMLFEYNQAWPRIRKGGILLSDDIGFNTAFDSFCKSVGSPSVLFPFAGLGCTTK